MSKSLGNLILVRDLLIRFGGDALRLYLASHHYRSPWNHSLQALEYAARLVENFRRSVDFAAGEDEPIDPQPYEAEFRAAMDNDLDTPSAVSVLKALSEKITKAAEQSKSIASAQQMLRQLAAVLGLSLNQNDREQRVGRNWTIHLQRIKESQL